MSERRKVAVLGGGCGGLAAAWTLTATPELRERFDITVYERSWRLGGKGASGRMLGDGMGARIEEHGLHIWFGFYAHAFQMLREAYEESGLASGEDWWQLPFEKCDSVSLYERQADRGWIKQAVELSTTAGPPPTEPRPFSARRGLARASRLIAGELRSGLSRAEPTRGAERSDPAEQAQAATAQALEEIAATLEGTASDASLWTDDHVVRRGGGASFDGAVARLASAADDLEAAVVAEPEVRRGVAATVRRISARARLLADTAKLLVATLAGYRAAAGTVPDDVEFRAWLIANGASAESVEHSPVLRGLYDLTFAYADGDKRRPDLAAGKALQSLLWMIDYDGAFMWRMRAGMGDVVFSPLYLALRQRGVGFHFFSRVERLRLAADEPVVDAIDLVRSAEVRAGADAYEPLERIGDWWCWPAGPYRDQLAEPRSAVMTLERGVDFDDVVLAIPVGALREICADLAARDRRFAAMLEGARTVRTKALQLWLNRTVEELRGDGASRERLDAPATAYAEPFDTYCDMSHLLEAEQGGQAGPKGVAYFCAVLDDDVSSEQAEAHVLECARDYLERDAKVFWPRAFAGDRFDWNVLFDPQERDGPERLRAQYVRANVDASDRYVRTPAGGVDTRLEPERSGFENLVLAGDWTHNVIDGGCVEAAVISGVRAGRALIERTSGGDGDSPLPRYIEFGSLATAPAPLLCERIRLFGFPLQADHDRIRDLCDRVLGAPTDHALRYEPRFSRVLLVFSALDGMRSDADSHRELGTASYREAGVWIPVFRDGKLLLFMPFLWLDDPVAIASGREMYGFAKTYASVHGLRDPSEDPWPPTRVDELRLDAHGLASDGRLGMHELLRVGHPALVRRGEDGRELTGLPALAQHAVRSLTPPWLAGLREGMFNHVLLKQIRDAERPDRAALQQVVEAVSKIDRDEPQHWRLTGPRELEISQAAGAVLLETLGIPSQQRLPWGFVAEFGFRLEPGEVVWPPRPSPPAPQP